MGVGADGSLLLLDRVDAVMQPFTPRPELVFPPPHGVTALATLAQVSLGELGLACVP